MPDLSRPNPATQTVGQRIAQQFPFPASLAHWADELAAELAAEIDAALAAMQAELARERAARAAYDRGITTSLGLLFGCSTHTAAGIAYADLAAARSEAVKILSGGGTPT